MLDLERFSNPALHFSGGKDSLALLYMAKPQLEQITVYHVNTGDRCPETAAVVEEVRKWIPHFVEVSTDSKDWRKWNGMPSDLAPAKNHPIGVAHGMADIKINSRFECCAQNLMLPMHMRMLKDGVDCVIRGTKKADGGKVPVQGSTAWYEVMLPLHDWSHQEVFDYLKKVGAPDNLIYSHFKSISAPECLTCTAWWDDGKANYLRARHPEVYTEYRINLLTIAASLQKHLTELAGELE